MKGLSKNTSIILEKISGFDFFHGYYFVGGSALAVQIGHRLSEDLDFCKWKSSANDKPVVEWAVIESNLKEFGIKDKNILDYYHVDFLLDNKVKISFYANQSYSSPVAEKVQIKGNIYAPTIEIIGVMKLELMLRRANFRDYYDIYSILKQGVSLKDMVYDAGKYSNHTLKSKNILSFISGGDNYKMESGFEKLNPKYQVNEKDIEKYIKTCITKEFGNVISKKKNFGMSI